jgi:hypothetical protein
MAFRPADLAGHIDGLILATAGKEGLLHRLLEGGRQREADRWLNSVLDVTGPDHLRIQLFKLWKSGGGADVFKMEETRAGGFDGSLDGFDAINGLDGGFHQSGPGP